MTGPALGVPGSTGALVGPVAHDLAGRGVAQRSPVRALGRAPTLGASAVVVLLEPAATPAEETGREVTSDDENVDVSYESRKPWGAPPWRSMPGCRRTP